MFLPQKWFVVFPPKVHKVKRHWLPWKEFICISHCYFINGYEPQSMQKKLYMLIANKNMQVPGLLTSATLKWTMPPFLPGIKKPWYCLQENNSKRIISLFQMLQVWMTCSALHFRTQDYIVYYFIFIPRLFCANDIQVFFNFPFVRHLNRSVVNCFWYFN